MLPFDLRTVSPGARRGRRRASGPRRASRALGRDRPRLGPGRGGPVRGRLLPGIPEPGACALVPLELTALAGQASLRSTVASPPDWPSGSPAPRVRSRSPRPSHPAARAVVELAVLGALDGIAAETDIETAAGPAPGARDGAPARPLCVELTVAAAGTEGRALLLLPEDALRALSRSAELPDHLATSPSRGRSGAGPRRSTPSEVDSLRPGDVLAPRRAPGEHATLRLPGGLAAPGRLDGDSLEVKEVDMDPEPDLARRDLPVVLDVELASVPVPLRDLARIAPARVLLLGLDRDGRVTLRIGERAVARGELVEVDGAVGVRILALEPP